MNSEAPLQPAQSVLSRELGDVLVVLNGTTGRYYTLDRSAARIWRLIAGHESLDSIVETLTHGLDGQQRAASDDIRSFVEAARADGLIEINHQSDTQRVGSESGPTLQINSTGLAVNGSTEALQQEFARNHYVHLPQFIEPGLLKIVMERVEAGEFVDRAHHGIGTEQCLVPGITTSILQLLFNDPALLKTVADIAACAPVKCFDGRVYRMAPSAGHYDSWHSDAGEDRLVAISLNLSPRPYAGGLLEIREASSAETRHVVANDGCGNAVMFRISPALRHRVTAVTGANARTAYAGWFRSSPDFQDLFFASLPTAHFTSL